jgi:hypothetical protein
MTLGCLPVETREANPLRGRARSGAEQVVELRKAGGRVAGGENAEVVVEGLVFAFAELRTELLNLRVVGRGQKEEFSRIFDSGEAGVVAAIAVESGEPEELVPAQGAASSETPDNFAIGRSVRARREGGEGGGAGVFYPLREGIARALVVLAVEEKGLAVELGCALRSLDVDAASGCACALGFRVAGDGLNPADGGFTHGEAAPAPGEAALRLAEAARLPAALRIGAGVLGARLGESAAAEGETGADAVDCDVGRLAACSPEGGLRSTGCG